jgi:hypothetical protein
MYLTILGCGRLNIALLALAAISLLTLQFKRLCLVFHKARLGHTMLPILRSYRVTLLLHNDHNNQEGALNSNLP